MGYVDVPPNFTDEALAEAAYRAYGAAVKVEEMVLATNMPERT